MATTWWQTVFVTLVIIFAEENRRAPGKVKRQDNRVRWTPSQKEEWDHTRQQWWTNRWVLYTTSKNYDCTYYNTEHWISIQAYVPNSIVLVKVHSHVTSWKSKCQVWTQLFLAIGPILEFWRNCKRRRYLWTRLFTEFENQIHEVEGTHELHFTNMHNCTKSTIERKHFAVAILFTFRLRVLHLFICSRLSYVLTHIMK